MVSHRTSSHDVVRARPADLAPQLSVLPSLQAACVRFGHHAPVPPVDRRALEATLFSIPLLMIGAALVSAGATTAAVMVLTAAVMVVILGGVRVWRNGP